jgi:hypothetical protein
VAKIYNESYQHNENENENNEINGIMAGVWRLISNQ